MRTHPRISVAATAVCNYIANARFGGYLDALNRRNFANDSGETF